MARRLVKSRFGDGSAGITGVHGYYDALRAKAAGQLVDQCGAGQHGGVEADLVGAIEQQHLHVGNGTDAATHGEGDIDLPGYFAHQRQKRSALFIRGRDVEKNELIGTLGGVAGRQGHRVAGVAQALEADALDGAAVFDVEAGNEAFGEHLINK